MRGLAQTTHLLVGASPMRQLRAIRISRAIRNDLLVPRQLGTVASVHRSAINVRRGPRMLTIALDAVGGLPNGLTVASPLPLDRLGVRPGMTLHGDGSRLSVTAASLVISLSSASAWSPTMAVLGVPSARQRSTRAAEALVVAAKDAPPLGLGPLIAALADRSRGAASGLAQTSAMALADLIEALQAGQSGRAVEHAARLVGLGPGATPSGDDLLVGLSAGLAATGHRLARPFARQLADAAAGRTTALAETFLWHAGRGEFAERVHRTAAAVLTGDPAGTRVAVRDALAWGASSGADLLVGLLVGIQADASELPARLRATAARAAAAA